MTKLFAFLIFIFFNISLSFSQEKRNGVLLEKLLLNIEKKFEVKFSSASKSIVSIYVSQPPKTLNLKKTLLFLNQKTSLTFKRLGKRYITITKKTKPRIEPLNTVFIAKYLTTGLQKTQDGSLILTPKKFGILPGLTDADVLQSIQSLPGVESENESINYLNVRGGTNDQNLILWEDIKMYHSSHFFGLISAYNPTTINQVKIIKNGTSALLGDGISSTIKIHSKDKITKSFNGGFNLNLISTDVFFEIPMGKKLALYIYGRKSLNDFFKTITYKNYFEKSFQNSNIETQKEIKNSHKINSDFSFYDYNFKLLYNINPKNKLRVNFIQIKNKLSYEKSSEIIENQSRLKQQKSAVGIRFKTIWNSNFSSKFNGYFTRYSINANDVNPILNQKNFQLNQLEESHLKMNNVLKLKPFLNLNFGFQVTETGVLNTSIVNTPFFNETTKEVLLESSFFSEIVYHKKFTYLRAGARINTLNKNFKTFVEPRFNLQQKITPYFKINVLGEFKHQSLNQYVDFKNDFLGVENRRWVIANNQNIPLVKSKQISIGGTLHKNSLKINFTSFYKIVNGITASGQGFQNQFKFKQSQGSYQTLGSELLINKTAKKYSTWFTYVINNNNYSFYGFKPNTFVNNLRVAHAASLAFNYDVTKSLKVSFGVYWKTGNVYTKPVRNNQIVKLNGVSVVNFNTPNGNVLPNYFRMDASLKYNLLFLKKIKSTLSLGILNITNQKNIIQRHYKLDKKNGTVVKIDKKSLALTPNLNYKLYF